MPIAFYCDEIRRKANFRTMTKGKTKKSAAPKILNTPVPQVQAPINAGKYPIVLGLLGVILLGIIIYSNSFTCGFHLDDSNNIVNNLSIRNLSDLNAWLGFSSGRPVAIATFALNYHFNQLDLWYWHAVNVAIHLINACLVYWFTSLLFATPVLKEYPVGRHKQLIALLTALMFVSHPLATQSVTYIVQRMTSMAAMFYLLSLSFYIKARLPETSKTSSYGLFVGAVVALVLALFSKENAYTLPVAIVLVELCFLNTKKLTVNVKDYRVILLGIALIGIVWAGVMKYSFSIFNPIAPNIVNDFRTITPVNYLLTQFSVILKYIGLLVLPIGQNLDYDFPLSNSFFEPRTMFSFVLLMALLGAGIYIFKKNRLVAFAIFWFFATLSIESSIIPISDLIFEHRTYLPAVGYFLVLSYGLFHFFWDRSRAVALGLFLLLIGSNALLTFQRNKVWKDEFTLWSDVISKSPNKARGYDSRGNAYYRAGKFEQAIKDFNKAIELQPAYGTAYNNRGNAYKNTAKYKQALEDYSKAIELQPKYAEAYSNRGLVLNDAGKFEQALTDFEQAVKLQPNNASTYLNRGIVNTGAGKFDQAITDFNQAISLVPDYTEAYLSRGMAHAKFSQPDKAIADYSKAIEMNPQFAQAYVNRGVVFGAQEQPEKAIADYNKAIEIDPKYATAWYNRGNAYGKLQKTELAIADYTRTVEIDPKYKNAWCNRGNAYLKLGQLEKAIADYNKAIEIDPNYTTAITNRNIVTQKLRSGNK